MSNVRTLPLAHVLIESGRCTANDDPHLIGRWIHCVSFTDDEGGIIHDYIGTDRAKADQVAVEFARDMGCRIIDRSEEDPRR